jgi:uncharacterized protein YndB with AHSA1/START domain
VTKPLRLSFDVACSVEHAFMVWTSGIGTWWPRDHTVTGHEGLKVVLEGGVGGRIFERTPEGVEHDWGEVTVWEPPQRLAYRWHLRQDRADATEVDIRFRPAGDTSTRIEIEHHGWERLGAAAHDVRDRNRAGWESLLPHYLAALTEGHT